ncbi:MAG: DMT family transporter [Flavobacteriaceae bacterium]|tara:strand:- start:995 stop:1876 length:882 start_codon:yes stop_codon:yes gene_type:complete
MNDYKKKWFYLAILSLIWGSSFILIKKGLVGLNSVQLASLRMIFAASVIYIYSYNSIKKIPKKSWKWIVITAYLGTFFPVYLISYGQTEIESGLASIITTVTPINTLIIGIIFFSLTFSFKQLLGLFIGLVGAVLLLYEASETNLNSNIYFSFFIYLTTVGYAASVNLIKKYLTNIPPEAVTAGIFLSISPPAIIVLYFSDFTDLNFQDPLILKSIFFVLVLGVFGSAIAQTLFNKFVKISSPIFASAVTYTMPVVAIFWALIDGEILSIMQFFATAIILIGVYLVNKRKQTS